MLNGAEAGRKAHRDFHGSSLVRLCMMEGAHRRGGLNGRWGCQLLRKPLGPDLVSCNQILVGLSFSHLLQGPHPREAPLALCPGKGWAPGHGGVGGEVRKGMRRGHSRVLCAGNIGPGTPVPQQLLASVSPLGGAPQGRHLYIFLTGPLF